MSIIILQQEAFKRVFKSKLTWTLILIWVAFVAVFLINDIDQYSLFDRWFVKGFIHLMVLFAGFATIFFFRYHSKLYVAKINNQNQLLQQREKMLMKINEKLVKQSKFLNLVTDSFSHPFFVVDAQSYEIVIANKAFYQYHDLPEKQVLNKNKCYELSHQFNHPCDDNLHPCPLKIARKTKKSVTSQHIHKDKFGNDRVVEVTAFPVFDEATGIVTQIIEYNVDITERINEQSILAEKEERLRTIINTSPDGIVVTDLQGKITFASEKSAQLLGFTKAEELLEKNVLDFLHPSEIENAKDILKNLLQSNTSFDVREFKTIKQDGSYFYQETNVSQLIDKGNNPYALVLVTRDITERKNYEKKLLTLNTQLKEKTTALEDLNKSLEIKIKKEVEASREKDRILALHSRQAAMGEMIGNIAHQWRQPLNTINLIIFDLLEAHTHGELNEKYLHKSYNEINNVVQNMSQTIDDFRNFFHPNKEKKIFDIHNVIEQTLLFTSPAIQANNISIVNNNHCKSQVRGFPNELMQTLINIINNAKDALIESNSDPKTITINSKTDQEKIIIEICNNGGIISPEHYEKIFDPYYSTKPEGQGTGLGLFISKTIIEKNLHGKLAARNTEDGVCFHIELNAYKK